MKSKRNKYLRVSYVFSLLGFIDSIYLTIVHYVNSSPVCNLNGQCEMVLTSRFSSIGPIPLAVVGVGYYFAFMILVTYLLFRFKNDLFRVLFVMISFALLVSAGLVIIQLFVLNAVCQYCLFSEFCTTVLFLLTLKEQRIQKIKILTPEIKKKLKLN